MMRLLPLLSLALLFSFAIAACGSDDDDSPSVQAPSAPTNVSATRGDGEVTIDWNMVTSATSYSVYYSTSSGVTTSDTEEADVTSPHTVTGLTNGTTYYFVVTATNAGGESPTSTEVSATPLTPPAAPAGLTAVSADQQITLAWTPSPLADTYIVYYSTSTGVTTANGTRISGITSPAYTLSGLVNGTTYYIIVTAENAAGEGDPTSEVSATPAAPTVAPAAPTLTGSDPGYQSLELSWSPVAGATSYNLYWGTSTGVTTANGTQVMGVSSPYVLTGLDNGTAYFVVVTASNIIGESSESNELSDTPVNAALNALNQIRTSGGGFGGAETTQGDAINVMVYNDASANDDVLSGIDVMLSDISGATIDTQTTDADGTVQFIVGATQPAYITAWDPISRQADTLYANGNASFRENNVVSIDRGVSFDITFSNLPVGDQLKLWLNNGNTEDGDEGAPVYEGNVGSATDQFFIPEGIVDAGEPWALMAVTYDSDDDPTGVAVLYDANGSEAEAGMQTVADLNYTAGSTSTMGLEATTGMPTAGTMYSGMLTMPSTRAGFMLDEPDGEFAISNSFGSYIVGGTYDPNTGVWTLDIPDFSAIPALEFSVEGLFLTIPVTDGTNSAALALRREITSTSQNIDLSMYNDLGVATMYTTFSTHTLGGANGDLNGITGDLIVELDEAGGNLAYLSEAESTSNQVDFPTLIGTSLPDVVSHGFWLNDFDGEDDMRNRALTFDGGRAMAAPLLSVTGQNPLKTGDTGSSGSRLTVDAQIPNTQASIGLNASSPTSTSAFDIDGDVWQWSGDGLTGRAGAFYILEIDADNGGTTTSWDITLMNDATTTAGGSNYSVRLPQINGIIGAGDTVEWELLMADGTDNGIDHSTGFAGDDLSVGVFYVYQYSLSTFLSNLRDSRIWVGLIASRENLTAQ